MDRRYVHLAHGHVGWQRCRPAGRLVFILFLILALPLQSTIAAANRGGHLHRRVAVSDLGVSGADIDGRTKTPLLSSHTSAEIPPAVKFDRPFLPLFASTGDLLLARGSALLHLYAILNIQAVTSGI